MLHEPTTQLGEEKSTAQKTKLGLILFFIYLAVYAGFVIIGLTVPEKMSVHVLGKQNLAIVYGFGLIVFAIILGYAYNYFCTKLENKMDGGNNK